MVTSRIFAVTQPQVESPDLPHMGFVTFEKLIFLDLYFIIQNKDDNGNFELLCICVVSNFSCDQNVLLVIMVFISVFLAWLSVISVFGQSNEQNEKGWDGIM